MSDRSGGEFWAFLAGALVGGVTALLLAPARGTETREYLRRAAGDIYGRGGQLLETGKAEAGRVIGKGREVIEGLAGRTGEKA